MDFHPRRGNADHYGNHLIRNKKGKLSARHLSGGFFQVALLSKKF